ncbi:SDR family oxidoreductase [Arcobacter sp. FWKO B]|uniref:SDR family oxidoreductase n=1 Tax=Arcobacter sp. FWKO B TaxID=2593672 RepID=UPI0018A386F4|nr:SDR family oxidoreductase [Arcobacter sp. FWKO B]QOG11270.1 SDR family oxidoreductase [Arcobacter sp. FWKO B]
MNQKIIVVTGASQGIGLAIVKRFLKDNQNNKIIMVGRESDSFKNILKTLKSEYKNEIIEIFADFSKINDIKRLVKQIILCTNQIDVLVNNAGYTKPESFLNACVNDFRHTMEINLISPFVLIQDLMKSGIHPKKIINIASTSGIGARPGWLTYAASKAAMISMSDTLREELKVFGTDVICISPGRCATNLRKILAPDEDPSTIMQPENVANIVLYLSSEDGKYLTSHNLIVR